MKRLELFSADTLAAPGPRRDDGDLEGQVAMTVTYESAARQVSVAAESITLETSNERHRLTCLTVLTLPRSLPTAFPCLGDMTDDTALHRID